MGGYQLFNTCPFAMASVGGGGSIGGIGGESYTWTHVPCLETNCRLWTYKADDAGAVVAQGCSLQFFGLTVKEIQWNNAIRQRFFDQQREAAERVARGDCCENCVERKAKLMGGLVCQRNGATVGLKAWCEHFHRK